MVRHLSYVLVDRIKTTFILDMIVHVFDSCFLQDTIYCLYSCAWDLRAGFGLVYQCLVSLSRLQISSMLASKYPSLLPGKELVPLLSTLCQLLSEQRRGERGPYVLRCLREVARCQALHPDRVHAQGPELHKLWSRIWTLAIRGAGFPQTEALSLDLLDIIIQGGLIPIDKEFWKLFTSPTYKPSRYVARCELPATWTLGHAPCLLTLLRGLSVRRAAATCLAQALLKCAPLKITDPSPDHLAVEGFGPPSFKELSISWLLCSNQSEEMEESSKPHLIVCRYM